MADPAPQENLLKDRRSGGEEVARKRFATATRSASFSMSIGIREVRMLQSRDFRSVHFWAREELNTLQRLIDKGLVTHVDGQSPCLSEAGELMRQLLVLSGHITLNQHPEKLKPQDILEIMNHGLQWYRDGCGYLDTVRIQRGATKEHDELRIKTKRPDYDVPCNQHDPKSAATRPMIRQEWRIKRSNIEETG